MKTLPWPQDSASAVLFIVDASNATEQTVLSEWIEQSRAEAGFSGPVAQVVVPIAADPENIPIAPLSDALNGADAHPPDTLLVPLRVAWTTPEQRGDRPKTLWSYIRGNPRRPNNRVAASILSKTPEQAVRLVGAPATLEALSERFGEPAPGSSEAPEFADFVAGQANLALDVAERQLRGGRYKVPRRVANHLMRDEQFKTLISQTAQDTGQSPEALRTESAAILKELVAKPTPFWQDIFAYLNRKMMALGYEDELVVDPTGLQRFKALTQEQPCGILWTHKTHIDGFAVYSMLFDNDCPPPHVLGGVNMAFAGLGFLGRRSGAIFIRRSFRDDALYKGLLRQYLGYLLRKRFPLTWAFEGTRSRMGKLMPPRYGMFKYVLEAAQSTGTQNLHLLPVAINYDLIGDVRDYAAEQGGLSKRAESLRWFIGYIRRLRQPMGRIYVDFGDPVVVTDNRVAEDPVELAKLALQVGVQVNRVTPVTLPSLVTMTLLGVAPKALTRDELIAQLTQLIIWVQARGIRTTDTLDERNTAAVASLADALVGNGLITLYDEGPEPVYAIAPSQHLVASYYRNTTIHHFVNKAIAELALAHTATQTEAGAEAFWAEAERLRDLFKFEFFYSPTDQFHDEITQEMGRYEVDWEARLAGEPASALHLLQSFTPLIAHATLLPFVDAYRVVANIFGRLEDTEALDEKTCVSRALTLGRQAYLQRRIASEASIGKLLFQNGYKLCVNMNLNDPQVEGVGARRRRLSLDLRTLAHRLDHIRAMASPTD